jgi:RNA polymerase sigma-70 factor (ECF subfamily)
LVERLRAGDAAAFKELVDQYQSRVFSLIWGILRDPNHVEDVAQQVFVKIYFCINQFDCRSSLYTWIHKIAVNECFDFLRKKRARKVVYECETVGSEDGLSALDRAVDCSPTLENTLEQREFVLRLLDELSPEDRSLLLLKEVDGYSVEELSAMTGMNGNTVKVRLFRARKKAAEAAQRLTRPATVPTGREISDSRLRELKLRESRGQERAASGGTPKNDSSRGMALVGSSRTRISTGFSRGCAEIAPRSIGWRS